jgi:protoporphyrinogen oxidase
VIIGAGPAGLTAALELLRHSAVQPVVLEAGEMVGGIARTESYKGNRIDIGGHRFFSKSDRVMQWWLEIFPLQRREDPAKDFSDLVERTRLANEGEGPDPDREDAVMPVRNRRSRIYYLRRLFDYPVSLGIGTFSGLGPVRSVRIILSYLRSVLRPEKEEKTLEQFLVNRFGRELYQTFFKEYTEKVWGVSCREIGAEWGAQRIKGLSIRKAVLHYLKRSLGGAGGVFQKNVETSLIERFLYPKFGPGQLWEEVARRVQAGGGEIRLGTEAGSLIIEGNRVTAVRARDGKGQVACMPADYVISTMPVRDLVLGLDPPAPPAVAEVARGLTYRDFITVGLLVRGLKIREPDGTDVRDNWIYIQEPDVRVGRLQIFNNWSPYLVASAGDRWIGLEYFCSEGDDLWSLPDAELVSLAARELERIDILEPGAALDGVVIRTPKTYPGYFGTYARFGEVRDYLDRIENLFLAGRNGMHRYNNQDHSMLTAMAAVENIVKGRTDKENIWAINAEEDYHEVKGVAPADGAGEGRAS